MFGISIRQRPASGSSLIRNALKQLFLLGPLLSTLPPDAIADEFKLSESQRISCTRGHRAGKLSTVTCRSYVYVFNVRTTEYFRCSAALAMTRDNTEVINVHTDGGCANKPRIFENDSTYSFDATETEPPSMNSVFGTGGHAVWASDNTAQRIRACIVVSSGLGSDVSQCLDMTFN
jgi:hypothetical protein